MFTVIAALILLGLTTLGINNMLAVKTTTMLQAEASLNAISIAQTMIDEIETKSYDAATAGGTKVYDPSNFTAPASLGCNASEASSVPQPDVSTPFKSVAFYNDVDDYQNYRRVMVTPVMGPFTVVDTVVYVSEDNPDTKLNTQTFYKRITVTVTHANMSYPLKLTDVAIYRKYF
jgi:hypothetical protein